MMAYYYVKGELNGVPKGTVERFADFAAGPLVVAGAIERFDSKKHADAPGAEHVPVSQRRPPEKCPSCGTKRDATR